MYFMQRDMSCDNLALCLPCPVLSVAYVKDRRLSGGPGTSSSLFTSDLLLLPCLMTLASWNLFFIKVGHEYNLFGLLWNYFYFCCHSWWFLLIPRALYPIFVLSKIFFPPTEKYTALTSPPPFCCHCISNIALCMAFSELWAKPFRLSLEHMTTSLNTTNIRDVIILLKENSQQKS